MTDSHHDTEVRKAAVIDVNYDAGLIFGMLTCLKMTVAPCQIRSGVGWVSLIRVALQNLKVRNFLDNQVEAEIKVVVKFNSLGFISMP